MALHVEHMSTPHELVQLFAGTNFKLVGHGLQIATSNSAGEGGVGGALGGGGTGAC